MRIVRAVVLAIAAVLTLLGGAASIASADPGSGVASDDGSSASADPADPNLPPDE